MKPIRIFLAITLLLVSVHNTIDAAQRRRKKAPVSSVVKSDTVVITPAAAAAPYPAPAEDIEVLIQERDRKIGAHYHEPACICTNECYRYCGFNPVEAPGWHDRPFCMITKGDLHDGLANAGAITAPSAAGMAASMLCKTPAPTAAGFLAGVLCLVLTINGNSSEITPEEDGRIKRLQEDAADAEHLRWLNENPHLVGACRRWFSVWGS